MNVFGHLTNAFGLPIQGSVVFRLVNYGPTVPSIPGFGVIGGVDAILECDAGGFYSGSITGNDVIQPEGTLYQVSFQDANNKTFQVALYNLIGGGNILLDTYPQVTTLPIPTGAVPSSILTANNIWTGSNYFPVIPVLPPSSFWSSINLQASRIWLSPFSPKQSIANASLGAGWGNAAVINSIVGTDQAFVITVLAAGTGQAQATATISIAYVNAFGGGDPAAPSPISFSKQTGGTAALNLTTDSTFQNRCILTYQAQPIAGLTYAFTVLTLAEV